MGNHDRLALATLLTSTAALGYYAGRFHAESQYLSDIDEKPQIIILDDDVVDQPRG